MAVSLTSGSAVPASAVERQLSHMLASPVFARSPRLTRFMEYVVKAHLDGRDNEIKQYSLGVEVFDRPAGFDPRVDPIVRVEATRLRHKIREYYQTDGITDDVSLTLTRAGYQPIVGLRRRGLQVERGAADHARAERAFEMAEIPRQGRSLAVLTFKNLTTEEDWSSFGYALSDQVANALTRNQLVRVISRHRTAIFSDDIEALRMALHVEFALGGSVQWIDGRLRSRVHLIDTATGFNVWANILESEDLGVFKTLDHVAAQMVRELRMVLAAPRGRAAL